MDETTQLAVRACLAANVPVLLWGPPGIGKSSVVDGIGAVLGVEVVTVLGSTRESSDFAGLPVVQPDGRSVVMAPPSWALHLAEMGEGLLFLDDLTTAAETVQKAMLRVVLDREVGDLTLPRPVMVIGAANGVDDAPDGTELSPALANRWAHFILAANPDVFCNGLTLGWDSVTNGRSAAEQTDPTPDRIAKARAEVAGFIRHRPAMLHNQPTNADQGGRAWPSCRTWEWVADVLPRLDPPNDTETTTPATAMRAMAARIAVAALVGEGAAIEFFTWRREADLPDPEAVLADPAIYSWSGRADRTYAVLTGVVAVIAARPTVARWGDGWRVLAACAKAGHADVGAAAAVALGRCKPNGVTSYPAAIRAFTPVLLAAGLLQQGGDE
jgi:hypothetical protein